MSDERFDDEESDAVALADNDWNIAFGDLRIGDCIGRGSFGVVYKARYSGIDVAVKQIKSTLNQVKEFEHEVAMLRALRHPNIVLFMGVSRDRENLYLVQEFISGGSLSNILGNKDVELPWRTRIKMALDTASALLYLHNKKCLHRDLKCENVLIEANSDSTDMFGRCKLADFGLATLFIKDNRPLQDVGTPWYRAPELSSHHYGISADVFSFGIALLEIITRAKGEDIRVAMTFERKKLHFGVDPKKLEDPTNEIFPLLVDCPAELLAIAQQCASEDPALRPTMAQVVDRLDALYKNCVQIQSYAMSVMRNLEAGKGPDRVSALLSSFSEIDSLERSPSQMSTMMRQGLRVWSNAAISNLPPECSDVTGIVVPFDQILDVLSTKLAGLAGRTFDNKGREFLESVIDIQPNAKIDVQQFGKFWNWYYTIIRTILHPGVKPLFRDGFIHGFVSATLCSKLLVDANQEGTVVIRFSTSRPGCLVITCYHGAQLKHVLVTVDFMETLSFGCFALGNQRCSTLKEVFTKNNLHIMKYIYPTIPIGGEQFQAAHQEIEERLRKEIAFEAQNSRTSTGKYDDILAGYNVDAQLFPRLKMELVERNSGAAGPAEVPPTPAKSPGPVPTPTVTGTTPTNSANPPNTIPPGSGHASTPSSTLYTLVL